MGYELHKGVLWLRKDGILYKNERVIKAKDMLVLIALFLALIPYMIVWIGLVVIECGFSGVTKIVDYIEKRMKIIGA